MMKKKPAKQRSEIAFCFRTTRKEIDDFRQAAERDGFEGNVSMWIRAQLRNAARQPTKRNNE